MGRAPTTKALTAIERFTVNGETEGNEGWYYPDDQIWLKVNYKNGKEEGRQDTLYRDGSKHSERSYLDGQLDGWWRILDKDGNLTQNQEMRNGEAVK